jgi:branched-subunit amino acid transport protein
MMKTHTYFFIVMGMGVVTFLPRWVPLIFFARRKLPEWFVEWLDLIPAAILSALLFPALMTGGEPKALNLTAPELIVAIPTFAFAFITRSLGGTVIVGMLLFWIAGHVI